MNDYDRDTFKGFCILARKNIRMALDRLGYDDDAHAILVAHFADLLSLCDEFRDFGEWEAELEDLDL